MDRINGADWVDIGGGKRGFRDENRASGVVGTEVTAAWLNGVQEEMAAVIESELIALSAGANNQLLTAIEAKLNKVRVNLPIYPEILTASAKLTFSQPSAGTVRLGAGEQFVMRGSRTYTTAQTDFATAPNKTYHILFTESGGFGIFDLASSTYNPTALAETNPVFDSGYDKMFAALVTTGPTNVAAITPLANKTRLKILQNRRFIASDQLNWGPRAGSGVTLNWARSPAFCGAALTEVRSNNSGPDGSPTPSGLGIVRAAGVRVSQAEPPTRYKVADFEYYYEDDQTGGPAGNGTLSVQLNAEAD